MSRFNLNSLKNLNGTQKRYAVIGIVVIGIILLTMIFSGDETGIKRKKETVIKNVLTDQSTRSVSMDALYSRVKQFEESNEKTNKSLMVLNEKFEKNKEDYNKKMKEILEVLTSLKQDVVRNKTVFIESQTSSVKEQNQEAITDSKSDSENVIASLPNNTTTKTEVVIEDYFANAPIPPVMRSNNTGKADGKPVVKLNDYSSYKPENDEKKEEEDTVFLPSGSIITGTFINGLDAPTGQGASRDPFPTLMRIQKEAILPNQYQLDIKECFLILSGYGELSSERVFLRGETLSCIRNDGGVIESPLNSYAVGEDGKAGVRGRLVSREGQLLAKTLMAGFLSGMSSAFDVNAVPVISTGTVGDKTTYQSNYSPEAFQGAAAKGASRALEKVADYYLNMAESIFPVIELDAGRQVDVIVNKGTYLKIKTINK